ncbi:MAG: hypothetical protein M1402_05305 [Candidatus Thermoplasmatota archaeon]|jgi:hypothetical protein|nr:hypothetical protein [Candidatus Thermoplasmatota archaeon]
MIGYYGSWNWYLFLAIILALIAISLVILGILTAYFGSGKSRTVGVVLLVVGLVIGLVTAFTGRDYFHLSGGIFADLIVPVFFYVVAVVIGVVIGLLIFLAAIMKT